MCVRACVRVCVTHMGVTYVVVVWCVVVVVWWWWWWRDVWCVVVSMCVISCNGPTLCGIFFFHTQKRKEICGKNWKFLVTKLKSSSLRQNNGHVKVCFRSGARELHN